MGSLYTWAAAAALSQPVGRFFIVQLSHPYMTTGKTIALTIQTFVNKVMSLLFNTLSGLCRGGRNELGRVDRVQGGK